MQETLNKVLLVDDDTVTNLMHERQIIRSGLAQGVDVATDGQMALDYLTDRLTDEEMQPELILLDINMPRMNGFEFLERYAQLPDHLHRAQCIMMVSTSTLQSDRARAEADPHVKAYEFKPMERSTFIRAVSLCQSVIHRAP